VQNINHNENLYKPENTGWEFCIRIIPHDGERPHFLAGIHTLSEVSDELRSVTSEAISRSKAATIIVERRTAKPYDTWEVLYTIVVNQVRW
jgi:hypothetical protein